MDAAAAIAELARLRAALGMKLSTGGARSGHVGTQLGVVVLGIGQRLDVASLLGGVDGALVLKTGRGYQALDLGGLSGSLLVALTLNGAANDVLAHVVLLGQVKQLLDLGGALGTQTAGLDGVGKPGDLSFAFLDNDKVAHRQVGADNASANGLTLAGTGAALTEARGSLSDQQANTVVAENTLLHGETLLVVTARDAEDVALEVVAQNGTLDFMRHTLVVQVTKLGVIVNLNRLLAAGGWEGNIELHAHFSHGDLGYLK